MRQENEPKNSNSSSQSQNTEGGKTKSNQIEIPSISLPKGGGAIKGIDEKFQVNAANGTASLSLPLPFSPARNGFMPAIALSYNSGAGNGIFGLGWDLAFPSIQRKTDKRLPRYRDEDESDVFMFSGAEDLVPYLKENGEVDEFPSESYHIRRYRPRIEGGFSRIEKITHLDYGMYWKVTTRENVVTFFGKTKDCRIADPADPLGHTRVFQWLPELSYDDKGNCVLYEFKTEDGAGYGAEIFDTNRFAPGQKPIFANSYLKRVYYCPATPFQVKTSIVDELYCTANPPSGSFLMELVFDYGEHGNQSTNFVGNALVNYDETETWQSRDDSFSTYRSGFEIRTARLCHRVLMFHHFELQLGPGPCLVRSLDLQYRDWSSHAGPEQGKKMEVTYLVAATQRSYIREIGSEVNYRFRGLPPVEFVYQELQWNQIVQTVTTENLANAPVGLSSGYQWVDLYNEGIAGVFTEQGEGWYYKENLGNGQFTPAKQVFPKPSFTGISSGTLQLQDLEADGRKQVVLNSPGLNGYFELTEDNGWEPFHSFVNIPNVNLRDPNTRMLDLNGDGQPEIVITEENVFTWYPSAGTLGYDTPELAPKPFDEEKGPAIIFADNTQSIYLADMSGDGLTDIARIRNGEVCYWPNLGYGRFGAKVTMKDSPWFDSPDQFNPVYLQLADVSGTGATDLIYLGKNKFRGWLNLSGNAWSDPCEIDPFLDTVQPNQVSVTDLLGNGTSCIVWSSPLPAHGGAPMRYIDLMGGKKPHILTSYNNNFGKTTAWEYTSSTQYYLEDKKSGKPWITKLPFPVQVVSRVIIKDKWRNTCFSNRYSYHHGYYDHAEREFRGFGRVEQIDIENFGEFAAGNINSPYITIDQTLYQPPVKTITWYHTGAFISRERILNQYEQEYFRPNGGSFHENELPEPHFNEDDLSPLEYREALRACKGMPLRVEIYELAIEDSHIVTDQKVRLFSTAFHNCHIQRLQARGENRYCVFLVTESEAITYHYELPLENGVPRQEADPRIAHTLNLAIDDLGNILQAVSIGYPRWRKVELEDELMPEGAETLIQNVQEEMHIAYTENQFTKDIVLMNDLEGRQNYRLRVPCEVKTYELSGLVRSRHFYFSLSDFSSDDLLKLTPTAYHLKPITGLQKRIVEQVRILYFHSDLITPLPFGELNHLGLPYETYKIALTKDLLDAVLGDKLPILQLDGETETALLDRVLHEGGYYQFSDELDTWWIRSGVAEFHRDPTAIHRDPAAHFYLPVIYTDPFNYITTLNYGPFDLFIQSSIDPLGNTVSVEEENFDYRVMAPTRMHDINNNISEVKFDILGIPTAMALRGKRDQGDSLDNFTHGLLNPEAMTIRRFFTEDYNETVARQLLDGSTARHLYYLGETIGIDGEVRYGEHPACAAGILREKHVADLSGIQSPIQCAFEYSDGGGAVIATKVRAEPENTGGSLRWITNGKTVLNNKGKPVKQFEPYFIEHHRFEEPVEVGVSSILYYDAAGRVMRTEMPDVTLTKVEFSPWLMRRFDANDTVKESPWFVDRRDPNWVETNEAPEEAEQRAAFLAKIHDDTPAVTHLDSLGREVVAITHNRFRKKVENDIVIVNEKYQSYTKLDAEGKPLWLQDARNNYVMVYARVYPQEAFQNLNLASSFVPAYDIAGNLLFQHSNEAGDRWMLPDTTGQPMYAWDNNEYAGTLEQRLMRIEYDALRRPLRQWLYINESLPKEISRIEYGESTSDASAHNLRGKPMKIYGPEGLTHNIDFDFKGSLKEVKRRLVQDATITIIDWQSNPAMMHDEFVQKTNYDALGRMVRMENWHIEGHIPVMYTPTYNQRGILQRESLSINNQSATDAIINIEYNAKGQRTRISYGNNTTTRYEYDPNTFRLLRLLSTGLNGTNLLQDLSYNYDPVGNITQIEDQAQDTNYFRNQQIKPTNTYEYDALYRLISASGREHANNTAPGPGADHFSPIGNIPDENNLRLYTQYYTYDPAGNFQIVKHIANGGSWTRTYSTEERSNHLVNTLVGDDIIDTVRYQYDKHGSMLNFANVSEEQRNFWNYQDMIQRLDLGGGGLAWYNYDSQKQRSRKVITNRQGEVKWERIYLGGYELYRRYNGGGSSVAEEIETHHLFVDDQRVLIAEHVRESDNEKLDKGVLYRYQYGNHLGSVALEMTGGPGEPQIISYEEYHPYGTTAYQASNRAIKAVAKRYRYTGMERDEESGLAYHTARYYLPWLVRWGSVDPIGIKGGLNLYRYSNNCPIKYSDKKGKQSQALVDAGEYLDQDNDEAVVGFADGISGGAVSRYVLPRLGLGGTVDNDSLSYQTARSGGEAYGWATLLLAGGAAVRAGLSSAIRFGAIIIGAHTALQHASQETRDRVAIAGILAPPVLAGAARGGRVVQSQAARMAAALQWVSSASRRLQNVTQALARRATEGLRAAQLRIQSELTRAQNWLNRQKIRNTENRQVNYPTTDLPNDPNPNTDRGYFGSLSGDTTTPMYVVRVGPPGRYFMEAPFRSLQEAIAFARETAAHGEAYIREKYGLPSVFENGSRGNPVDNVSVYERNVTTGVIRTVGPIPEGGGGGRIYQGGATETLLPISDARLVHTEPVR